jgi:NAD(P)-dependent dehydrogenase (short-subunit alcohol dehydrogenase family)
MATTGSIVVTGAARGIGCRIAERFARTTKPLVLIDRDPSVQEVAARLDATAIVVDVTDTAELATRLQPELSAAPPWLLVNNHGIFDKTPILDIDLDRWDQMQAVNVRSMVGLMQLVVPAMIAAGHGGRVVNIASMAAKLGTPGEAAYAASKAAVVALTRIAAMEFGPHNITVNAICPGYVLTEMGADTRSSEQIDEWSAKSPLGRLACADDVAEMITFLSGDAAGYITGEALNITGGMCTW